MAFNKLIYLLFLPFSQILLFSMKTKTTLNSSIQSLFDFNFTAFELILNILGMNESQKNEYQVLKYTKKKEMTVE